jgi:hypothetical protein
MRVPDDETGRMLYWDYTSQAAGAPKPVLQMTSSTIAGGLQVNATWMRAGVPIAPSDIIIYRSSGSQRGEAKIEYGSGASIEFAPPISVPLNGRSMETSHVGGATLTIRFDRRSGGVVSGNARLAGDATRDVSFRLTYVHGVVQSAELRAMKDGAPAGVVRLGLSAGTPRAPFPLAYAIWLCAKDYFANSRFTRELNDLSSGSRT